MCSSFSAFNVSTQFSCVKAKWKKLMAVILMYIFINETQEKVRLVNSCNFFGSVYIHCTSFSESVIYIFLKKKTKAVNKKTETDNKNNDHKNSSRKFWTEMLTRNIQRQSFTFSEQAAGGGRFCERLTAVNGLEYIQCPHGWDLSGL